MLAKTMVLVQECYPSGFLDMVWAETKLRQAKGQISRISRDSEPQESAERHLSRWG